MRIGIDLMGSETPPQILYQAVLKAAAHFDASDTLVVLSTQEIVNEIFQSEHPVFISPNACRIEFLIISEVITMGDDPVGAIRHKKGSSLAVGIKQLRKRTLNAFISAGNTGALIAGTALSLPLLPGIKRPVLLAELPTKKGSVAVIDVGGSVKKDVRTLVQSAIMGAAYRISTQKNAIPSVGLLNIGVESKKGTNELRQAYQILQATHSCMAFLGNVEGREVFEGKVDVLVTDGFTGNILLKSVEGVSEFIFKCLHNISSATALEELQARFDYAEYPGAIVCGVDGVIIKCHGNASFEAFFKSILKAGHLVRNDLVNRIKSQLNDVLQNISS